MSELSEINLSQKNKSGVDLSREIDQATINLYALINKITKELGVSYVVIGATARDLVLHHGFGVHIRRATTDIDFGMQVESWDDFEKIKAALIDNGFVTTKNAHRLIGPNNTKIDVVPFGKLEDKSSNIQWPPKGDFEMSVLGFQEAHDNAIEIILQQEPLVVTPVASPQGIALLKIISWSEREHELKKKDAEDLSYLLETYEKINSVNEKIFESESLMNQYDWNITLASAHLLGLNSASIAGEITKLRIHEILEINLKLHEPTKLVSDMCVTNNYNESFELLKAFANGFSEK